MADPIALMIRLTAAIERFEKKLDEQSERLAQLQARLDAPARAAPRGPSPEGAAAARDEGEPGPQKGKKG